MVDWFWRALGRSRAERRVYELELQREERRWPGGKLPLSPSYVARVEAEANRMVRERYERAAYAVAHPEEFRGPSLRSPVLDRLWRAGRPQLPHPPDLEGTQT